MGIGVGQVCVRVYMSKTFYERCVGQRGKSLVFSGPRRGGTRRRGFRAGPLGRDDVIMGHNTVKEDRPGDLSG